jgi:hypothetical protein
MLPLYLVSILEQRGCLLTINTTPCLRASFSFHLSSLTVTWYYVLDHIRYLYPSDVIVFSLSSLASLLGIHVSFPYLSLSSHLVFPGSPSYFHLTCLHLFLDLSLDLFSGLLHTPLYSLVSRLVFIFSYHSIVPLGLLVYCLCWWSSVLDPYSGSILRSPYFHLKYLGSSFIGLSLPAWLIWPHTCTRVTLHCLPYYFLSVLDHILLLWLVCSSLLNWFVSAFCVLSFSFLFSLVSCPFFPLSTVYVSPKSSHTTCSSLHTNLDLPCGHDLSVSSAFGYCPLSSQLPQITSDHLVLLRFSSFSPFISHYSLDHFPGSSPAFVHRHCTGQLPFVPLSIRLSTCFLASWRLPVAHPHYSLTVLDQILSPSLPSSSAFSSSCLGLLSSLSPSAPLPLPSLVLILHFTPFGSLDNHLPYKLIISFKIAFIFPQPLSSLPASVRRLNQPQRVIISRLTTGHFEPVTPNGLGLPFSSPSSTCDLLPGHVLSKLTSSKFNLFIYIYIYIYI